MDEGEVATERISDDSEEMVIVLTSMDATTVLASRVVDVSTGSGSIPTASTPAEEQVPTGSDVVSTASLVFATATVVTPYSRRKGKEVMVKSETPKKQRVQKQINAQVARELEEQLEREDQRKAEQIARDAEIARIHAKEELQIMINGLDRSNETLAKYLQEYHQFALELLIERRIELITDLMEDFIPMGSKEEAERIKRKGLNLEQESAKKQKTSEEVPEEAMFPEEVSEEKRSYWKITRLGGSSASYQFFIDLLKHLDREDLNQLWRLVKETLSNRPPTIEWKLYDSCEVHDVTAKDKEIFMLVEKDYPLKKGPALVMICYKLQVENYSQMASDLILKIHKIASSPMKKDATARRKVKPLPGRLHCYQKSRRNCQSKSNGSFTILVPHITPCILGITSYVPADSNSFVSADVLISCDILGEYSGYQLILSPWKQAEKIYVLGSNKWYQSLLRALTKEEFFSPFNLTSLTTISDTDSLVNSVHEGDAPEQKVTPPPQITTNYISSTDLQCWNIVQKGNSQNNITTDTKGNIIIAPPVTVEEHMQVQREEKVRTMLLTALPDEHMGDFYHMIDSKHIWSAIKARFGGNAESTRMRRSLLKHQFKEYKASEEEGLDGGYDNMQKILSKMNTLKIKPDQEDINMKFLRGLPSSWANIAQIMKIKGGLEYMSLDDLYNKLKCLEIDTKGSSSTQSSAIDDVIYSLLADYEEDQHLAFKDLDQVNKDGFDEYEIKHQMAMIAIKARKFEKKYVRRVQFDSREAARFDKKLAKCFKRKKTGHFARECRSQVSQESTNYKNYKKKEAAKEASESLALVVIDGSQGTNSTVPADAVPARAFISAKLTIPADRVIVAKASVLAGDGIPADLEFAMMSLPSKVSLHVMCPLCNDAKSKLIKPDYQAKREQLNDCVVNLKAHKNAVKTLEKQIKCHQKNQIAYDEKIRVLSFEVEKQTNMVSYK
nr:ribonuclease H-like domain-containing protein [Tanacetum cinerariifolium]